MSNNSTCLASYPIDFQLYNENSYCVLYIENDPNGQTLYLDISNASAHNIKLKDIGNTASAQNQHFELHFRPQTLASVDSIKIGTDGWSLYSPKQPGPTSETVLYLLHEGPMTIAAGSKVHLTLTGLNADGAGGTRGTRVELLTKNMHFEGAEELLESTRLQYLEIINHRGRNNIPLHVGCVGGDTVLSDGKTPNTLRLRIANSSRDRPLNLSKESRFQISFDVQESGETREWALISSSNVNGVNLKVAETNGISESLLKLEKSSQSQTVIWTASLNEKTTLTADGYIILEFTDLVALTSIGQANIYINFENIPDYRDEQMAVVVNKSPLLYSTSNNVGIGTTPSDSYKLQVVSQNNSDSAIYVDQSGEGNGLHIHKGDSKSGNALWVAQNNSHSAIYVSQGGSGQSLYIAEQNNESSALYVAQKGSGYCARLFGQVEIGGEEYVTGDKTALCVNAKSNEPALWVDQNGEGSALYLSQKGSGYCADFEGKVKISGKADLQELDVSGKANLQELQVTKTANLQQGLDVNGKANLQELQVTKTANLQGLDVSGKADLQELQVTETANLQQGLQVAGTANVQELQVTKTANLQGLQVNGKANLQELQVAGTANLQGLQVNSKTIFKKILAGSSQIEASKYLKSTDDWATKRVNLNFNDIFSSPPHVIVTARSEEYNGGPYDDVFAITVRDVSQSGFTVNISRVGPGNNVGKPWEQRLNLDWLALEMHH